MPAWLVHAAMLMVNTQEFHLLVFPAMQNLPIMPAYLAPIVLAAIPPVTGLQYIQVRTPALQMKAGMESIMGIHPVALAILLHSAAPLAQPATMEMKAMKGETVGMTAMMIDVIK